MIIRTKLTLLVALFLLMMSTIGLSIFLAMSQIQTALQQERYSLRLLATLSSITQELRLYAKQQSPTSQRQLQRHHQHLTDLLTQAPHTDAELSIHLSSIRQLHTSIHAIYRHVRFEAIDEHHPINAHLLNSLFNLAEEMRGHGFELAANASQKIQTTVRQQAQIVVLVSGLALATILGLAGWIYRSINRPLQQLFDAFDITAKGHFETLP